MDVPSSPVQLLLGLGIVYWVGFAVWSMSLKRSTRRRSLRKQFPRAVCAVLANAPPDQQIAQIRRHHDSYSAAMNSLGVAPQSLATDLWSTVIDHDRVEAGRRPSIDQEQRNRIAELVAELEGADPFSQVPAPWSLRLRNISVALKNGDVDSGAAALSELSGDLRRQEEIVRAEQDRRDRRNLRLQWAGIILGVVSFAVGTILTVALTK